jgi:hypothetical protein
MNLRRSLIKSIQSHWKDADGCPFLNQSKAWVGGLQGLSRYLAIIYMASG